MIQIENSGVIDSQFIQNTGFDHKELLKDGNILKAISSQKKILAYLRYAYKNLNEAIDELILQTDKEGSSYIEQFTPFEILKMFSGLEIHSLQKIFETFTSGITLKAFVLITLTILEFKIELTPFILMGLIGLYDILVNKIVDDKKKTLSNFTFPDFLNMFIKNQVLLADSKSNVFGDDLQKKKTTNRIKYSKNQDVVHHDTPLREAHYSEGLEYLFSLDDNCDHIRVYSSDAQLKFKIKPMKNKHPHQPMFINHFAWAENKKILCLCMQDSSLSFFDSTDFTFEICYQTIKLQLKIWYLDFFNKWFLSDSENQLSIWDETTRLCNPIPFPNTAKVSDIIAIKTFGLMAISTFDKKIILWHLQRNQKILSFSLSDSSAKILKYSEVFNLFIPACFDNTVKCYQYDLSNEFSKIGKLEHSATITAVEVSDQHEMIITCDDNGNLKTWHPTLKSSQILKFYGKNTVSKILMLTKANKFCILSNRIQFYDLYIMDNHLSSNKSLKILPCIIYNKNLGILTISTHTDLKSFNIDYGVVIENYNFDSYAIKDKVRIVKYSHKNNWFCYSDIKGNIRQLISNEKLRKPQKKFQPFLNEAYDEIIWDDKFEIMIVWSKNIIKIYKYEEYNTNTLLRQLELPEKFLINNVKLHKQTSTLALIINDIYAFFMDLRKFSRIGCLMFCQNSPANIIENDNISGSRQEKVSNGYRKQQLKPLLSQILKYPLIESDDIVEMNRNLSAPQSNLLRKQGTKILDDIKCEDVDFYEIDHICFVHDWNCIIAIYNERYISMISYTSVTIKYKTRIYLKLPEISDELKYRVCKSKKVSIVENRGTSNESIKDEYYVVLGDNKGKITMINITKILEKNFIYENKERITQPYSISHEIINEKDFKDYIEQQFQNQIQLNNNQSNTINLVSKQVIQWKAHDTEILNCKIINHREILIISIIKDGIIKIWDINSNMLCHFSLNDKKINTWNIVQSTLAKKKKNLIQVRDFMTDLADEFIEIKKVDICKIPIETIKSSQLLKVQNMIGKRIKDQSNFPTLIDSANSPISSPRKTITEVQTKEQSKMLLLLENTNSLKMNNTSNNNESKDQKPKALIQKDKEKGKMKIG